MSNHRIENQVERREFLYNTQLGEPPAITHDLIALHAYRMWEYAGRPDSRDQEFWYRAESALYSCLAHVIRCP